MAIAKMIVASGCHENFRFHKLITRYKGLKLKEIRKNGSRVFSHLRDFRLGLNEICYGGYCNTLKVTKLR